MLTGSVFMWQVNTVGSLQLRTGFPKTSLACKCQIWSKSRQQTCFFMVVTYSFPEIYLNDFPLKYKTHINNSFYERWLSSQWTIPAFYDFNRPFYKNNRKISVDQNKRDELLCWKQCWKIQPIFQPFILLHIPPLSLLLISSSSFSWRMSTNLIHSPIML